MENKLFQKNNPNRQKLIKPIADLDINEEVYSVATDNAFIADNEFNIDAPAIAQKSTLKTSLKMSKRDVKNYIKDLKHLQDSLRTALKLELSTIPPYLCGLYTIKEGSNVEAAALIRSVVVEEMLHMVLVSNILNAITDPKTIKKGDKLFNVKDIIPNYPTPLPGGIVPEVPKGSPPFEVHLLKFSREALDEFSTIERPSDPKAPITKNFDSIGQFYEAIRYGLLRLNEEAKKKTKNGIFIGDPSRQITAEHYYGSGGKITKVVNYEDAEEAIGEIVGQGEGIDGTIATEQVLFGEDIEYAHYFKFQEICFGRMYSANDTNFQMPVKSIPTGKPFTVSWSSVYNMKANPKMKDYEKNPELLEKAKDFNKVYVQLLNGINDAVSGEPELLIKGITVMYELKYKALELLNIPLENGECAGPTFEYVEV
ncbi:Ferritin-like [Flavobacterium sp. CF108]|uniref:ferritin-like domain-containing protein n=1 Tax=unclassified Flavobacterium TaxID=196869 RepID=UPI0008C62E35|nr:MULTISPECIES: ferritin-like protein [unclassified Flavobacterium]SEO69590.1 Ferritin-like [Flavobacterium sp. fv08]SHH90499.1 Ferritin-like [Flavobacterium sp. CF108]